jgi:hypothetical protein
MEDLDFMVKGQKDINALVNVLKGLDSRILIKAGKGPNYYTLDPHYDSDGYYEPGEVTVTPGDSDNGDGYDGGDSGYSGWGDDSDGHSGGGGGGEYNDYGNSSNDQMLITEGLDDLNYFQHSVDSNQAIYVQGEHTDNGLKFLTATSDALNFHSIADLAINAAKADVGIIKTIGLSCGAAGIAVNGPLVYIGFTDGTISPSDWCAGISTILSGMAIASTLTGICAPAGLVCEGLSICFGIASMVVPGDNGTPGGMGQGY